MGYDESKIEKIKLESTVIETKFLVPFAYLYEHCICSEDYNEEIIKASLVTPTSENNEYMFLLLNENIRTKEKN